jgi:hypothetical protein
MINNLNPARYLLLASVLLAGFFPAAADQAQTRRNGWNTENHSPNPSEKGPNSKSAQMR